MASKTEWPPLSGFPGGKTGLLSSSGKERGGHALQYRIISAPVTVAPMEPLLLILGILAVLGGIAGTVLPILPGPPLVFGGLWLIAWLDGYAHVGAPSLWMLGILAALALVVDYLAAVLGVKRVGASGLAVSGALVGGLVGLLGGVVGAIVGPIVGAMAGEWLAERNHAQALRVGAAAGVSFLVAMALKLGIVFAMLGVFALAWWV